MEAGAPAAEGPGGRLKLKGMPAGLAVGAKEGVGEGVGASSASLL